MFKFPTVRKLERHWKAWGWEDWIVNNDLFCGKILHFHKGGSFSLHSHYLKQESFLIRGKFILEVINTDNADRETLTLNDGDIIDIPVMLPHKLTALEDGDVIEISTHHSEYDSYRYEKGDSQKENP